MGDKFSIPGPIPPDVMYQWNVYSTGIATGWKPVPFERLSKFLGANYMGANGEIICDGLVLMEKPAEEVRQSRQEAIDKAIKNEREAYAKLMGAMQDFNSENPDVKIRGSIKVT